MRHGSAADYMKLAREDEDAPQGVRGRNSDNTLIREKLGWEPSIPLRIRRAKTYRWIYDQEVARMPIPR
jgi:nucleoside-diphosphate-sugar epimerase